MQDHDGSHIKGLLINFIHSFWPSLLKVPTFMVEFTTPIIRVRVPVKLLVHMPVGSFFLDYSLNCILFLQAFHSNGSKQSFYSMPEFERWRENLGNNATGWKIKYYKVYYLI